SAAFSHNSKYSGDEAVGNKGDTGIIASKSKAIVKLSPSAEPVRFACNLHSWMNATVWVFDHPYAAVTDEDGRFILKHVPTGVELGFYAWHEDIGDFGRTQLTLKKGQSLRRDLTVKK